MKTRIFEILANIVKKASGIDINKVDIATDYISLGFDSLVVVRIDQGIKKNFNLEIDMGLYYEELDSPKKLLDYISANLPSDSGLNSDVGSDHPQSLSTYQAEAPSQESISILEPSPALSVQQVEMQYSPTSATQHLSGLENLLSEQMRAMSDLMHRQLDVLSTISRVSNPSVPCKAPQIITQSKSDISETPKPKMSEPSKQKILDSSQLATQDKSVTTEAPKPKMSEVRAMKFDPDKLNDLQQRFIAQFIPPYIERTKSSKEYAKKHRPHLADWINTLGFRRSIKEIVYPIVAERSLGSRIWDIDGNEYIDIAMCYGVNLFGHSPKFVIDAVKEQLERGFELGPQNRLVGEVAALISEMTGMERVAFCNTGSEAVMMALRAAQALTRKDRIALFMGSYHGNADLVIKDTLLLRYGEDSALTIIRENAHELAAVLVEPVQSRNPSLQPKDFLHKLRALTKELGIILIFDEMINGFRSHPGGAQAIFGVRADMATYGKVPAGGMPIGIVAGSNECMRVIDGGLWDYGDDSVPCQEVIFFGGTFCKHPLTMAAAHAALTHIKNRGQALQDEVNRRTEKFATEVNQFFQDNNIGIKISWFASQFIFEPTIPIYKQPVPPPDMTVWFHVLMSKGIYTWERRVCFFSESHTDDDVKQIVEAIKESSLQLKAAGFPLFGGKETEGSQNGLNRIDKSQIEAITLPMTLAQQQLWFLSQLNENAVPAYIETVAVRLTGKLNREALSDAASDLVARHSALRTVMVGDGKHQRILPTIASKIEFTKSSDMLESDIPKSDIFKSDVLESDNSSTLKENSSQKENSSDLSHQINVWLKQNSQSTFDLVNGPLFSFKLLQLDNETHVLAMNFHHIVMDGRSVNVLLRDLMNFYTIRLKSSVQVNNQENENNLISSLSSPAGITGEGLLNALSAPAPDLTAYQRWLDDYLSSEECKRDQEFWTKLFPETIPMLDFPTDHSRPSLFSFKGARYHLPADPELLKQCLNVGRSRRMTPFMTMISLYTLWIHKMTGRDEVVVGFPVSGRFFEDSDDLVGYCTHLVPFVSRYDASHSFVEYLDRSKETLTAAYRHQKYPFGQLIRNLQFEQDMSRGSIIASEFNLDQVQDIPSLEGLTLSMIDIPLSYVKYDFNLEIMSVAGEYQFKFEYAADLFEPATVARMAKHFMTLLAGVAAKPEQALKQVSLLTLEQRELILNGWNKTYRDFPLDKPFHRLFEQQAVLTPDRIAASFAEPDNVVETMTYKELNAHANRLARQLITASRHVPLIPILADRSCRFLTAMIGVFKAGCAYLPLDPEHPAERIAGILSQFNAEIILAERQFANLIDSSIKAVKSKDDSEQSNFESQPINPNILWFEDVICNEPLKSDDFINIEDKNSLNRNTNESSINRDSSENLAYVIFTSGSTGKPKGAMVQQKGMVNHIYAKIEDLSITADDVVAQNASQCFDISVWQFLSPLLKGGRVQIMSTETAHDPVRLMEVSARQGVTILEVVPSLLRVLLEQIESGGIEKKLKNLRWLVPTGEALPPVLCSQWFNYYPDVAVLNAYGPTECSDDVAHYPLHNPPSPDTAIIPIGKPVANMRLYILDQHLEPVPIGVAGELWVGGVGVGLGYLNQPELTNKAFIPDPFYLDEPLNKSINKPLNKRINPKNSNRLYRTGDLAQFLPDGNILFLGREDHQVKIRGFRIEIGEIEAVLSRHPLVKELVVTASSINTNSSSSSAQTSLTAYIVFNENGDDSYKESDFKSDSKSKSDSDSDFKSDFKSDSDSDAEKIDKIRNYLSQHLPAYMVPAYFVPLSKLPLTANGKIDRKALPDPASLSIDTSVLFTPPRNETEKIVAEILAGVLNRPSIGIHDNYFALGGDSIQAIQAVARIQAKGYTLKLRDIFQYPTVAELASRLTYRSREIDQGVVTGELLPTPLQKWLLSQDKDIIHHYNQAVTLHFKSRLNVDSLQSALDAVMIHHDALRIKVNSVESDQLQLNIKEIDLKLNLILVPLYAEKNRDSKHADSTTDRESLFESTRLKLHQTIDLTNGPLIKAALVQGENQDSLILVIHHLCVDAVSWQILIEDIVSAYNAHAAGRSVNASADGKVVNASSDLRAIELPAKTDSFKYWSEQVHKFIKVYDDEINYWKSLAQDEFKPIPADFSNDNGIYQESDFIEITLPAPDTTTLTGKAQMAYHTDMNDLLLTSLAMALHYWADIDKTIVALEGHGRDSIEDKGRDSIESNGTDSIEGQSKSFNDIDISRTVGWFTVGYPVMLQLSASYSDLGLQIKQIKESLRHVPNRGFNFGLIYPTLPPEIQERLKASISFNYLGAVDAGRSDNSNVSDRQEVMFSIEAAPHRELVHPKMRRQYQLEIESEIRKGKLHIQFYYNRNQYESSTVERLGSLMKNVLIQITDYCSARKVSEATPSDMTWSQLSLPEFETLLNENNLSPTEVQDIYPLTPMQENMLFHRLYDADSTAYFEQFSFNIKGKLNLKWFEAAWNHISQRHDILRTNFIYKGVPKPLQVVRKKGFIDWHYEDLSDVKDVQAYLSAFKIKERKQNFELDCDILIRMNIFKLQSDQYAAIWSYHHILMDGWCLGVLIQDVQAAYMELSRGRKPKFSPAPQYKEYIRWLAYADHSEALRYWSDYLDGFTPITTLPRDTQYLKNQEISLETADNNEIFKPIIQSLYSFEIDADISNQLALMSREMQITINTLVQSIWGLLLAERNGVADVVFGAAVSGRPVDVPNVEDIVGLFINTIPVRVKLPEKISFTELVKTLQKESLSSEPYHFISLAEIQTACSLEAALLDHVLIFQNYPLSDELEELQKKHDTGFTFGDLEALEETNYDLSVEIYPLPNLHFDLRYNPSAYSSECISKVAKDLTALFEAVAKTPDINIADLKQLLASEDELSSEADFIASAMNIDDEF
ncbi:MAG: amino acid adenylation domain-containing protein [Desulfamplus sp.]|nr:amino acid adenylation domain-containing protein [Desulfamplus sp.]